MSPQPQAAVGAPLSRVDGRLKVTGRAMYAADQRVRGMVHAVVVDSTVGRGRITSIDTRAALAQDGVLKVIHHRNAPRLQYNANPGSLNLPGERLRVFQDDEVHFRGQPVAVVVATTLEAAQHAASLVKVDYDSERPATDLADAPAADNPRTYARGDADQALRDAPVRLDMTYAMARNHHNAMELHATVARWKGDTLTLWDKTQWVQSPRAQLAADFGIAPESIRVLSPFVGGAFGNAARAWPHITIAALAAREVRRPVKLVLTRAQLYSAVGYRPAYEYKVRLGSDRRGRLLAMTHDLRSETSRYETFVDRGETYRQLLVRNRRTHLESTGAYTPPPGEARTSMYAYGAVFAEVAVDARLGLVRVRRMLGVFDAGRIISPKLADSQAIGAMVGGIGSALLEHTVTDHRDGRIVNANLADYLVPVNADVPDLKAIYVDGRDNEVDPLGVKGLGEVVLVGVAPAIANAVHHATGRRVRQLPIAAEALLGS